MLVCYVKVYKGISYVSWPSWAFRFDLKYLFNQARISFKNRIIIQSIGIKPYHCISHTPQRTPVVDHESDWSLVLEQQADLSKTYGDVSNLSAAVRHGADLRLYMTTEWYEETIYFQQTYVGVGEAVAGMMSHHHG